MKTSKYNVEASITDDNGNTIWKLDKLSLTATIERLEDYNILSATHSQPRQKTLITLEAENAPNQWSVLQLNLADEQSATELIPAEVLALATFGDQSHVLRQFSVTGDRLALEKFLLEASQAMCEPVTGQIKGSFAEYNIINHLQSIIPDTSLEIELEVHEPFGC